MPRSHIRSFKAHWLRTPQARLPRRTCSAGSPCQTFARHERSTCGILTIPKRAHLVAGVIGTLCIASFFVSTVLVELLGSHETVAWLKSLVVMPGLFVLVPAIAITGGSSLFPSKSRRGRLVDAKKKRMPVIAANGLIVLVPCARLLNRWSAAGSFDTSFYVVQPIELLAGAANLSLMAMNIRDGLKMKGRRRSASAAPKR